ncbi:rhomboid family intramembrane serine protease [Oceanithermus sp.]
MFPIRDSINHHGPALVTRLLIAMNVAVFFWQVSLGPQGFQWVVYQYGFIPKAFFADPGGQFWHIFTSMFMHGGFEHILGNMWFLWVFGPAVEARLGTGRYLTVYVLAGIGAALTQAFFLPHSTVPMIGASGAISGVLGAYFVLFPRAWVLTLLWPLPPIFFWLPAALLIGYWVLIQVLYGLLGLPGVAWWAHVGGFAVGYLLTLVLRPRRPYKDEPFWYREYGF